MYVVYHSSDSFVGVTCVSIASLLENNKDMDKIEIFYISKGISEENKKIVNHIDGNKQNNDLNNLEWCTSRENTLHGIYVLKTINQKGRIKK